eukprot:2355967-Rhodomonas_salina.1
MRTSNRTEVSVDDEGSAGIAARARSGPRAAEHAHAPSSNTATRPSITASCLGQTWASVKRAPGVGWDLEWTEDTTCCPSPSRSTTLMSMAAWPGTPRAIAASAPGTLRRPRGEREPAPHLGCTVSAARWRRAWLRPKSGAARACGAGAVARRSQPPCPSTLRTPGPGPPTPYTRRCQRRAGPGRAAW